MGPFVIDMNDIDTGICLKGLVIFLLQCLLCSGGLQKSQSFGGTSLFSDEDFSKRGTFDDPIFKQKSYDPFSRSSLPDDQFLTSLLSSLPSNTFMSDPFANDPFFNKQPKLVATVVPSNLFDTNTDGSDEDKNSKDNLYIKTKKVEKSKDKEKQKKTKYSETIIGPTGNSPPASQDVTPIVVAVPLYTVPANYAFNPSSHSGHPGSSKPDQDSQLPTIGDGSARPPSQPLYSVPPPNSALPAVGGALAGGLVGAGLSQQPQHPPHNPAHNQNQQTPHLNTEPKASSKCNYCIRSSCTPGSCTAAPDFDVKTDIAALRKAVEGLGTDEDKLIKILTSRSDKQLKRIEKEYVRFGTTLRDDIVGDTSAKFQKLLLALITPLPLFYADELHNALKKGDSNTLIEIMTSLSDCALRDISVEFGQKHKITLPERIKKETNLDFQKFILALARGDRDEHNEANEAAALEDANKLIKAGVAKWFGTDEEMFIDIFSTRSFPQLQAILRHYDDIRRPSKGSIEIDISKEFSGKLEKGLLTLVKNIKDQPTLFADELDDSLNSLLLPVPKDNDKLVRILRGRCSIDLEDIRENFDKRKDKKLADRVSSDTYLEYRKGLLALFKLN